MAVNRYEDMSFDEQQRNEKRRRRRRRGGITPIGRSAPDDDLVQRIDREKRSNDRELGRAMDEARRARHERIDAMRQRRMEMLSPDPNTAGPRAAEEPIPIPGYRVGLDVRLQFDADGGRVAVLDPGLAAVEGQLVSVRERKLLSTSQVEWVRGKAPGVSYFGYIDRDGDITIDPAPAVWDAQRFAFVHPIYADRVALGRIFNGYQDLILLASPGVDERVEVVVASSTHRGAADYRADGNSDELEINVAALYLIQRWGGGVIRLTSGQYRLSGQVFLRGPQIQMVGVGRATTVWRPDATEDAGTTAAVAVNLRARNDDDDEVDVDGEDGTAATQIRDISVAYGSLEQLQAVYHTGWGGTVEPGERIAELRTELRARVPELLVGPLNEDVTTAGAEQLFANGDQLILRRSDGSEWQVGIVLEAGSAEDGGVNPAIVLNHLSGDRRTVIKSSSLSVGGSISGSSLSVNGGISGGGISGSYLRVTGGITGSTLGVTGAVSGGSLSVSGRVAGGAGALSSLSLGSLSDVERAINGLYSYLSGQLVPWLTAVEGRLHRHIHTTWDFAGAAHNSSAPQGSGAGQPPSVPSP